MPRPGSAAQGRAAGSEGFGREAAMNASRLALCAAVCALFAAPPAAALTIANDGAETVNIWIEKWLYRLRAGAAATFNPTVEPVSIIVESRNWRVVCEAGAASEVRVAERSCIVDGAEAGASQFQL